MYMHQIMGFRDKYGRFWEEDKVIELEVWELEDYGFHVSEYN